jgi:hypothetical protein
VVGFLVDVFRFEKAKGRGRKKKRKKKGKREKKDIKRKGILWVCATL